MTVIVAVFVCLLLQVINCGIIIEDQNKSGVNASKNFFLGLDSANFFQAYINCKNGGMDLASINSQQDEKDITLFLRDVDKTDVLGYWLSGTNLPNVDSPQYYWLTGGKRAVYTNWFPGEPNNVSGTEHCLHFVYAPSGETGWNDMNCQVIMPYICQGPE